MSKAKPLAGTGQDGPVGDATGGAKEAYEVGYAKPPVHAQFKKGNRSGKGRTKGSKAFKTVVNEALGQKVPVSIGGKTKKLSKIELAVHQVATKASKGDPKAADKAISLFEERVRPTWQASPSAASSPGCRANPELCRLALFAASTPRLR